MRKSVLALLVAGMTLTSCGAIRDSRINPFNWFGRSQAEAPRAEGSTNPLIPERTMFQRRRGPEVYLGRAVDQIVEMRVERAAGGAVLRVKGIAATQGSFDVRLTDDDETPDGTLSYTLRALVPPGQRVGTAPSREVVAARFITDKELAGIRKIVVNGGRNARSSRR